jgi:hypothetical protein
MFDKFNNWYDNEVSEPNRFVYFMVYIIICYGGLYAPYLILNIIGIVFAVPLVAVAFSRFLRMRK